MMTIKSEGTPSIAEPVLEKICFADKDILEIGCGTGEFTLDHLTKAKSVYAVDPDSDSLDKLREDWISNSEGILNVIADNIEDAKLPTESFDVAIFSSSL